MLQLQYHMKDTLVLPDDEYQNIVVVMQKTTYTNVRDKIRSIDVISIDGEGNLYDRNDNIVMEPDNIDSVPLRIENPKIFAATWLEDLSND